MTRGIRTVAIAGLLVAGLATPAARADTIFIAKAGAFTVGEYDATTGAPINANFITGIVAPGAMTLDNSGHLFIISNGNSVLEFSASTGAAIPFANPITGLDDSQGVVADNNGHLFVTNPANSSLGNRVLEYSSATGALLNGNFITGLNNPAALARDASGNLYVANDGSSMINKYDANGVLDTNFSLTGVSDQRGMALDGNNHLYIGNSTDNNHEGVYDATTGMADNATLINSGKQAYGVVLDGNDLYVSYIGSNVVEEYNATTGAVINSNLVTSDVEFLGPAGMAIESSDDSSATAPAPGGMMLVLTGGLAACVWHWRHAKTVASKSLGFQVG